MENHVSWLLYEITSLKLGIIWLNYYETNYISVAIKYPIVD